MRSTVRVPSSAYKSIHKRRQFGYSIKAIAREFGVSQDYIKQVLAKRCEITNGRDCSETSDHFARKEGKQLMCRAKKMPRGEQRKLAMKVIRGNFGDAVPEWNQQQEAATS